MMNKFVAFLKDEEGATAVEYGLIIGLIAAVIVVIVSTLGGQVNSSFNKVSTQLPAG